jgi:hypothetical protein
MHFATPLATLLAAVSAIDIPSFSPPEFPISTVENDGVCTNAVPITRRVNKSSQTNVGRYDVRKTMAWLDPGTGNLNRSVALVRTISNALTRYSTTVISS